MKVTTMGTFVLVGIEHCPAGLTFFAKIVYFLLFFFSRNLFRTNLSDSVLPTTKTNKSH